MSFILELKDRLRSFAQWLLISCPEPLPHVFRKRQGNLLAIYEQSVRILLHTLTTSDPKDRKIAQLMADFQTVTGAQISDYERFERLLDIDARVVAVMPENLLMARRWMLLNRFRRLAPERAYSDYEASLPASTDKVRANLADAIKPDLINLTNYVQQLYILNLQREQALASIKWWLLTRMMLTIATTGTILLLVSLPAPKWAFWPNTPFFFIGLVLVFLIGTVGAVASISRKFQDVAKQNVLVGDPLNEITALNAGRESVAVSIMAGGIFALLLYLLVVTGATAALPLDLLPVPTEPGQAGMRLRPSKGPQPHLPRGIAEISAQMGFRSAGDLFRMMFLAFLAGFAERLVPDSIDRLIKREKEAKGG